MEAGPATPLTAAVSVCNSFNYKMALTHLESGGGSRLMYSKAFTKVFKDIFRRNKEVLKHHLDFNALDKITKVSMLVTTQGSYLLGAFRCDMDGALLHDGCIR